MVVMEVGKVGMFVDQDRMPEQMSVRLAAIPVEIVDVLVVRVVHVGMVRSSASCVYACADARPYAARRLTPAEGRRDGQCGRRPGGPDGGAWATHPAYFKLKVAFAGGFPGRVVVRATRTPTPVRKLPLATMRFSPAGSSLTVVFSLPA